MGDESHRMCIFSLGMYYTVDIYSFAAVREKLLTGTSGTDKREGESRGNRRCTRGNRGGEGGGGVGGSGKISIESDLCLENINYSVLCWEPREREEGEYSSGVPRTPTKKTSLHAFPPQLNIQTLILFIK